MQVNVEVGPEYSMTIDADEAFFDILKTELTNGTLKIESEGNVETKIDTVVTITMPELDGVSLSGAVAFTGKRGFGDSGGGSQWSVRSRPDRGNK